MLPERWSCRVIAGILGARKNLLTADKCALVTPDVATMPYLVNDDLPISIRHHLPEHG
jgi:hypothetical protein